MDGALVDGAEVLAKVCDKGISPDRFLGDLELVPSELSHPLGFAQACPVGGLVAGSLKAGYFDEGFREDSKSSGSFVAGSIYGGMIFTFQDGKVREIFLGAAAE